MRTLFLSAQKKADVCARGWASGPERKFRWRQTAAGVFGEGIPDGGAAFWTEGHDRVTGYTCTPNVQMGPSIACQC